MTIGYADFEFGLVWDEIQNSFDVSLRFTGPNNIDRILHPKGAVAVDLSVLADLTDDEEAYAVRLTESVLGLDEVRRFFAETMAVAGYAPVHFRLHVDGPVDFHSVRWELLRDPATQAPVATSRNVLFSRYLSGGDWRPIVDIPNRDLRALIVIAGPTDLDEYRPRGRSLAPVDVKDELRRAMAALAPFHPVALAGRGEATLANTINRLEQGFDILYLVGHGAQTDDVPLLFMENPDGTADAIDARRLEERIRNLARRPIVVLLNSCQSAGTGDQRHSEDGGALAALGPRLAAAGVPAVVAMQGNVTMTTASRFGPAFSAAFAQDAVVDQAVAVARDAVRDRRDWWVPVLFSRLRSGRIYYEPQFTERAEATWQILDTMMDTGNFTPVLGPGLADGILGSRQEIARRWARRWQMPVASHVRGNLAQVAQYLRVSHNPAMVPGELQKYLKTEMEERRTNARGDDPFHNIPEGMIDREKPEAVIVEVGRRLRSDPGDPFRVVAAMPVKVFITTGWTDLLQKALEDAEPSKKPHTLCFPWTRRVSWDQWDDPAEVDRPTVDRPWVYHLFGRLEDPRSLVLTEDDYFDWLDAWTTTKDVKEIVPTAVKAALTGSALLFLGYRLDDWDFRVVFQSIKSFGLKDRFNDHVGVQLRPESQTIEREAAQRYLESYFGNDKVNIFWSDTRTFLDELRERTGLQP
jgi:hypothetical protein